VQGSVASRLQALQQLAAFVGSKKTLEDLCCMLSPLYWQSQGSHSAGSTSSSSGSSGAGSDLDHGRYSESSLKAAQAAFVDGV